MDIQHSILDTSRARQAANSGPVFIIDEGRPTHVLLTVEDYQKLAGAQISIVDQLAMPGVEDVEFDTSRLHLFKDEVASQI
jgi:hypothetical protein